MSPKIVFFGTESFSLYSLQVLIQAGYDIAAVVTKPDSRKGRGQKLSSPEVKRLAEAHDIPVWQPEKLADIEDAIKALGTPLGVLASYGKIIPARILELFTPGIVNVHPSLLPKYRGPSPIESAIKNGDQETGVTIMKLVEEMDSGPLYAFAPLELTGRETRPELYAILGDLGASVLMATLPAIIDGSLAPQPQNNMLATYSHLLKKEDAWLKPDTQTAAEAERLVRAHLEFPKSKLTIRDVEIIITKSHVSDIKKTPLDIQFADGAFLSIDEVVAPSGKTLNAAEFLRGYPLT